MTQSIDRPAGTLPLPHLVTEIPGPRARAARGRRPRAGPRRRCRAPTRSCRCGARAATVEDIDGNRFLDFAAGIAVNRTGHAHPRVVAAIRRAGGRAAPLQRLGLLPAHLRRDLPRPRAPSHRCAGPSRVYLGNSGTEVVEAAIKLARRRHRAAVRRRVPGRRSTGGRTAPCQPDRVQGEVPRGFGPLLPGIFHAPYGRVEDLRWFDEVLFERLAPADEVAAIIVEPIQGEGGYIVPEAGLPGRAAPDLRRARHPAHRRRDPVGRRADGPDVGGRALGRRAGHPAHRQGHRVGHAPGRADRAGGAAGGLGAGAHGSTYGGNPVACAAALATLELLERRPDRERRGARRAGARRAARAPARYPGLVRDVRGRGLMLGIELDTRRARRGGPVGVLPARAAGAGVRPLDACACRRRSWSARRRWRPGCGSSARRSPRWPPRSADVLAAARGGRRHDRGSSRPSEPDRRRLDAVAMEAVSAIAKVAKMRDAIADARARRRHASPSRASRTSSASRRATRSSASGGVT